MPVDSTTAARWDDLHRDPRHLLLYPSEHVVRWLAGMNLAKPSHVPYWGTAIDIGCGGGRHVRLLRTAGWDARGVDRSVPQFCDHSTVDYGDMRRLPFDDASFGLALSYGVFYYGTRDDMRQAVKEMHRVMRPGGHGFLCLRSALDWRAQFDINGVFHCSGEPEHGMQMTFLDGCGLAETVLAPFKEYEVNVTHTTTDNAERANCDWLVSVVK